MGFFVSKPKPDEADSPPPPAAPIVKTPDNPPELERMGQLQSQPDENFDSRQDLDTDPRNRPPFQEQEQEEEERRRRQQNDQQRIERQQQQKELLQRSVGGIETKTLMFEFDVNSVSFNRLEYSYKLRLTVESLNVDDYAALRATSNSEWPDYVTGNTITTDVIKQKALPVVAGSEGKDIDQLHPQQHVNQFRINKFQFVLPKGFCVNDSEHDVTLLVEVLCLPDNPRSQSLAEIVGCFRFAIFPRHNIPKINLNAPPGDYLFRLTETVTLRRSEDGSGGMSSYREGAGPINMHCGTMNFTAGLREVPHGTGTYRSMASQRSVTPGLQSSRSGNTELLEVQMAHTLPVSVSPERPLDKSTQVLVSQNATARSSTPVDHYVADLLRHSDVVQRQNEELHRLRVQIHDLELNNTELRHGINDYVQHSLGRPRNPSEYSLGFPRNQSERTLRWPRTWEQDFSGFDGRHLAREYNALVSRLARQTSEVQDYREKVLILQDELIRKNNEEKMNLQNRHRTRPETPDDELILHPIHSDSPDGELAERVRLKEKKILALEELCRVQERVIEKMEGLIDTKTKEDFHGSDEIRDIQKENELLRKSLQNVSLIDPQPITDRRVQAIDTNNQLQTNQQESADVRIRSLEKQISSNARKWAHEKAELTLRLQESQSGLQRSSIANPVKY